MLLHAASAIDRQELPHVAPGQEADVSAAGSSRNGSHESDKARLQRQVRRTGMEKAILGLTERLDGTKQSEGKGGVEDTVREELMRWSVPFFVWFIVLGVGNEGKQRYRRRRRRQRGRDRETGRDADTDTEIQRNTQRKRGSSNFSLGVCRLARLILGYIVLFHGAWQCGFMVEAGNSRGLRIDPTNHR